MYLSTSEFKTYLGIASTADDALLADMITAAQAEIDNYCGHSFEGSTGTRYYRGNSLEYLPIRGTASAVSPAASLSGGYGLDSGYTAQSSVYSRRVLNLRNPLLSLGGLTNGDGTTIASTDCWLEPRNESPYSHIRLKTAESWSFGTDGEITVSGTWGHTSTAPAAIVEATREMAAYLYRLRSAPVFDVVADLASGTITVPKGMPVHVKQILDTAGYKRAIRFA